MGVVLGPAVLHSPPALRMRIGEADPTYATVTNPSGIAGFAKSPVGFFKGRKPLWWGWWLVRAGLLVLAFVCTIVLIKNVYSPNKTECKWCKHLTCLVRSPRLFILLDLKSLKNVFLFLSNTNLFTFIIAYKQLVLTGSAFTNLSLKMRRWMLHGRVASYHSWLSFFLFIFFILFFLHKHISIFNFPCHHIAYRVFKQEKKRKTTFIFVLSAHFMVMLQFFWFYDRFTKKKEKNKKLASDTTKKSCF